ncbi:MAG: hypothetical protein FD174_4193 [Geobacteraceae bacterium]|nr:MAG: hypothetical protein FD174_4193 [Geobacteraceae bacterium]
MKRIPVLLTLAFSVFGATLAIAAPEIVVEQSTFNFGSITEGTKVDHTFNIKNNGDAPLQILRVRPSCGCTAANASSPIIQPGKTGEIKTSFNSANFTGSITKTISLDTNDPKAPTYTLTLKGTVASEIQITPKQLNLGQIKVETGKTVTLTVENRGIKPLKLTSIKSPMPQVVVKTDKSLIKQGESATILVSVTPRAEDRFLSGYLSLTTDNPTKPEITVPIYGSLTR